MASHEDQAKGGSSELKRIVAEKTAEQLALIASLAEELAGKETAVEKIFPLPPEVRNDASMPDWTAEQEARAREVAQSFGYGTEHDVTAGLSGGARIIEGGKVWKILAEATAAKKDGDPSHIIFAGSPNRKLGEDELEFTKTKLQLELDSNTTEYDFAILAARQQVASQPMTETPAPFGYEVSEANSIVHNPTGQLVNVGITESGQSIQVLRIDREDYEEDGKKKYRHQPSSETVMRFVSDILTIKGLHDESVVLVTSGTYASRQPDAVRAGLNNGRRFGVTMYGRQTIRELGAPVPAEMPLNHLPGDLRVMYDNLKKLEAELAQTSSAE